MKYKPLFIALFWVVFCINIAFSSSLVFKHGNDAIFASRDDGSLWLISPPLVTNSSAPAGSHGLIFKHHNAAKLWTVNDKVNTGGGSAQAPSPIPSGSLMLSLGVGRVMTTVAEDMIYNDPDRPWYLLKKTIIWKAW